MANVAVREEAPDVTLRDDSLQEFTLSSLRVVFGRGGTITHVEHNSPAQIRDQKHALAAIPGRVTAGRAERAGFTGVSRLG